jgi:hypothetical protein
MSNWRPAAKTASWALMILGFGIIGTAARRRRDRSGVLA